MRPAARGNRPWLIWVGLGIAVGGLVAALIATRPHPADPRAGSSRLGDGPAVAITRTPAAYRIEYREENGTGPSGVVNTRILSVRRPFESRETLFSGPPPGEAALDDQTNAMTHTKLAPVNGPVNILPVAPGAAEFDVRVEADLDRLVAVRALEPRERRRVAGRTCQIYRSNGSLDTSVTPLMTGATTYSEACLDEAGLVLERLNVDAGAVIFRDVATSVTEDPGFPDDEFQVEDTSTIPASKGGGAVARLDPLSPTVAVSLSLPAPPAGFSFVARYAVAAPAGTATSGALSGHREAGVFDVYARGADFVTVENGGRVNGPSAIAAGPFSTDVDLGAIGEASVVLGTRGSSVVVEAPLQHVVVVGTLTPDQLVDVARQLRPAPQA